MIQFDKFSYFYTWVYKVREKILEPQNLNSSFGLWLITPVVIAPSFLPMDLYTFFQWTTSFGK